MAASCRSVLRDGASIVPGNAFEEMNELDALNSAREGARLATEVGFAATARAELAARTWEGIIQVADELQSPLIAVGTRDHGASA